MATDPPEEQPTDVRPPSLIPVPAPEPLSPGHLLGERYEIEVRLGAGGSGSVWRAYDRELRETVAVKLLRPELLRAEASIERLRREVKLARKIAHRNVCRVFDLGEAEGVRFITMELVDGKSLRALLAKPGPAEDEALGIYGQILDGLAAAHEEGVIHRDLKPENVMVGADGRVTVVDFGLAFNPIDRHTDTTTSVGTPSYMAPEQLRGESVDMRCDVFAAAIIGVELLSGEPPFGRGTAAVVTSAILRDEPVIGELHVSPAGTAAALRTVFERALCKHPDERFASCSQLRDAVARARRGVPTDLPAQKRARPGPLGAVIAGAALIGLVAALVIAPSWGNRFTVNVRAPTPPTTRAPALRVEIGAMQNHTGDSSFDRWTPRLHNALRRAVDDTRGVVQTATSADWTISSIIERSGTGIRVTVSLATSTGEPGPSTALDIPASGDVGGLSDAVQDELRLLAKAHVRRARAETGTRSAAARKAAVQYTELSDRGLLESDARRAEALLSRALSRDAGYLFAYIERARVHLLRGRLDQAQADIARADSIAGRDPRVAIIRCLYEVRGVELDEELTDSRLERAIASCTRADREAPGTADALVALARAQARQCDYEAALAALKRALTADRGLRGPILSRRLAIAVQAGRLELADQSSARLVETHRAELRLGDRSLAARSGVSPIAGAHVRRAGVLMRLRRRDEARTELERGLEHVALGRGNARIEAAALRGLAVLATRTGKELDARSAARLAVLEKTFGSLDAKAQSRVARAYYWTDPTSALRWLPPDRSCPGALREAVFAHQAEDDQRAQRALDSCKRPARWVQRCIDVIRAPLAPRK